MNEFDGMNSRGDFTYSQRAYQGIDAKSYNLAMTACLCWGFLVNYLICAFCTEFFYYMNPILFFVGYFVLAFAGTAIYSRAKNAFTAFLGFNLVALPLGATLSVFLVSYSSTVVQYAFLATALVTGIMVVMSLLYPNVFLSIGRALGFSLIAVVIVELVLTLIFRSSIGVIDYIVAIIFSLYIAYDIARAQQKEFTYVNAIKSAAELYIDVINLFIRIVSIIGRNSRDN